MNIKIIFLLIIFSACSLIVAKSLKGAEYRTKAAYTYGRFEVNMKSAYREGMLSSFFTYFDGTSTDPWSSAKWNEVDLEIMGRYDDNVQFNTITPGQVNHVSHFPMSSPPNLYYHTYAFEWTPDYVAWFVDGIEVGKANSLSCSYFNKTSKDNDEYLESSLCKLGGSNR